MAKNSFDMLDLDNADYSLALEIASPNIPEEYQDGEDLDEQDGIDFDYYEDQQYEPFEERVAPNTPKYTPKQQAILDGIAERRANGSLKKGYAGYCQILEEAERAMDGIYDDEDEDGGSPKKSTYKKPEVVKISAEDTNLKREIGRLEYRIKDNNDKYSVLEDIQKVTPSEKNKKKMFELSEKISGLMEELSMKRAEFNHNDK